jgi:hypothetical protein
MKFKSIAGAVALLAAGAVAHGASAATTLLFENFDSEATTLNWGGNSNFAVGSPP